VKFLIDNALSPNISVRLRRGTQQRRPDQQADVLMANLAAIESDLNAGSLIVLEPDRMRVRRLPILP
jgi:hypothetical protein